jgi:hypothetical protein
LVRSRRRIRIRRLSALHVDDAVTEKDFCAGAANGRKVRIFTGGRENCCVMHKWQVSGGVPSRSSGGWGPIALSVFSGQQDEVRRRRPCLHDAEQADRVDAAEVVNDRLAVIDQRRAEAAAKFDADEACCTPTRTQSPAQQREFASDRSATRKAEPEQGRGERHETAIERDPR